jgi:hypothetical protein
MRKGTPVLELAADPPFTVLRRWDSCAQAARHFDVSRQGIEYAARHQQCCAGRRWMTEEQFKELGNGNNSSLENLLAVRPLPAPGSE